MQKEEFRESPISASKRDLAKGLSSRRNASSMCKDLEPIPALTNERVRRIAGENRTEQMQW